MIECAQRFDAGTAAANRLAVLTNASSRANRGGRSLLPPALAGDAVTELVTHSADEVPDTLATLLDLCPDALAINGGDGTIHTLLSACLRRGALAELPPLAVLPGGTTNMNARDLGGGGALRPAMRAFLALRERPRSTWPLTYRPVLQVRAGDHSQHAGLFFSFGVIVRGVEFWQHTLRSSPFGAGGSVAAAVARTAWGLARRQPPFDTATRVGLRFDDGCAFQADVSGLIVTVLERLVLGTRPFWGPGVGPLACTYMDARPQRFLLHLPALLRGREAALPSARGYHSRRSERLSLDIDEPWLLDGEILHAPGPLALGASPPLAFLDLKGRPG